ncbi:AMP-binding protein [Desulfobotulus sp.]|uniref:AMP-binding protein n=1 Tax=Desulfobotulus sp. TaxID=1940337 RepID=UPI002A366620|nr:AMP-binding protein [Desulfobotulus sp.]MDY0161628.1 AMP-binding protein [Desulfobotulus sp.]
MQKDNGIHRENPVESAGILLDMIRRLASELHPNLASVRHAGLDSSLDKDFGLDSLGRVELLSRIEKTFGSVLPERVFVEAETPRDLLHAIADHSDRSEKKEAAVFHDIIKINPEASFSYPHGALSLLDVLNWHVHAHAERPHIRLYSDEGEDQIITYGELRQKAEVLAAGLQLRGVLPGDRVVLMLASDEDYFTAFFGVVMVGAVPVPIYPPFRKTQIEDHLKRHSDILRNCGALVLITMPEARIVARLLKSQVETLKEIVTVEDLKSSKGTYTAPAISARDIALLQYTSGSTGDPKGVVVTHENLLSNIRAMGEAIKIRSSDIFVSWLPLYHDMGLIGAWLGSLYFGITAVIMSPVTFLTKPGRWLWAIHRYRGTLSAAPNFAYELMATRTEESDLEGLDLSSWRLAFNGAEPVNPDTAERFCSRFASYHFRREAFAPVYGLAESSVGLAFPPPGRGPLVDRILRDPFIRNRTAIPVSEAESDSGTIRFMACGRPLAGHEIRIVDAKGREVSERHEGRLQFRGPSACRGYFRNAEHTARLMQGEWLDSGDLAYIAEGDVYITGRSKDMIIRAGRNIYPQELEAAVGRIKGIRTGNVAVFGSMDRQSGAERLIVLAETRETSEDKLENLQSEISSVTIDLLGLPPDDVALVPPGCILKTSSGKIRRSANRELYEQGAMSRTKGIDPMALGRLLFSGMMTALRRSLKSVSKNVYSSYCWLCFSLIATFSWGVTLILPGPDLRWGFLRRMSRFLCRVTGIGVSVQGIENLENMAGYIIAANHSSYIDSLILVSVLPRRACFVAKAELRKNSIARLFLDRIGVEYVERFDVQKGVEDTKRIVKSIDKAIPLLFFPEGTFTRMPGLLPFHMGAFMTSVDTGLPVVPVSIKGARSILRADSWFVRKGAVHVCIGRAIEGGGEENQWDKIMRLRDETRKHILRYSGEPDLDYEKSPVWALSPKKSL